MKYAVCEPSIRELANTLVAWERDGWALLSWHPNGSNAVILFQRDDDMPGLKDQAAHALAGEPTVGSRSLHGVLRQCLDQKMVCWLDSSDAGIILAALDQLAALANRGVLGQAGREALAAVHGKVVNVTRKDGDG